MTFDNELPQVPRAPKRTPEDRCGYAEGVQHQHIEQCHRGERRALLSEISARLSSEDIEDILDDLEAR